jgi:hypothetical protein
MLYLAVHFTWAKLKHLACDLNIYDRLNHEDDRWIRAWIKEYVIVNKSPIGHSCTFRKLIHMEKVKVMKMFLILSYLINNELVDINKLSRIVSPTSEFVANRWPSVYDFHPRYGNYFVYLFTKNKNTYVCKR